jgi:hypothetical protein
MHLMMSFSTANLKLLARDLGVPIPKYKVELAARIVQHIRANKIPIRLTTR